MTAVSLSVEVRGMDCVLCVAKIKSALGSIKGVESVDVSLERSMATLRFTEPGLVREDKVRKAITKVGFLVGNVQRGV
jgi:copper chaperone CopZ